MKMPGQCARYFFCVSRIRSFIAIEQLNRLVEIIPVVFPLHQADEQKMAEHYGEIRAALECSGQPIGVNDLWIAAHARSLDCPKHGRYLGSRFINYGENHAETINRRYESRHEGER